MQIVILEREAIVHQCWCQFKYIDVLD